MTHSRRALPVSTPLLISFALLLTPAEAQTPSVLVAIQDDDAKDNSGDAWEDMDYGPYLSTAVHARNGGLVYKGIVLPLDVPGDEEVTLLFDTDLLRYAAGWSGGLIEFEGIVYNGTHGTYPSIDGEVLFTTPGAPGWSRNGSFEDPRDPPYGPLPRNWARYRGLSLDGERVVLHYTVGSTEVRESADLISDADRYAIRRSIWIGPSSETLSMVVSTLSESEERWARKETEDRMRGAFLPQGGGDMGLHVRLSGDEKPHLVSDHGQLLIEVPPSTTGRSLEILLMRGGSDDGSHLDALTADAGRVPLPAPGAGDLTTRYPQSIRLGGELNVLGGIKLDKTPLSGSSERVIHFERERCTPVLLDGTSLEPLEQSTAPARGNLLVLVPGHGITEPAFNEDGLVARFEFDEGKGVTPRTISGDDLGLRLDGSTWRRGRRGRCIEFDGTDRALFDTEDPLVNMDEDDVTFAAWVETAADGPIFGEMHSGGEWVPDGKVFFVRDGVLAFDVGWVGDLREGPRIDDGRWHHVAFTWRHEDGEVALFVDGELVGDAHLPAEGRLEDKFLLLGNVSENFPEDPWLKAKVDGLLLYERALEPEEVQEIYLETRDPLLTAHAISGDPSGMRYEVLDDDTARLILSEQSHGELLEWRGPARELPHFARIALNDGVDPDQPFAIDRISWPDKNPWESWMRFGGMDFMSDPSEAALSTWSGDVWHVKGLKGDLQNLEWRRIATGLNQPLGLKVVDDTIYTVGRDQITRLRDFDGDGETDYYEVFNNDINNAEHFHEPSMDLQVDEDGNFYFMKAARHALRAQHPHHGTLIRVSKDGQDLTVLARGFRASNGLGVGPGPTFYGTDQEGYWMPANRISLVEPGGFYGNAWGWLEEDNPQSYAPPICWVHPSVDRSPAEVLPIPANTLGGFGPGLLQISYGTGKIFSLLTQNIDGQTQGLLTELGVRLPTGVMRGRVHPESGDLYVCGLVGWSTDVSDPGGFYRIRRTAAPMRIPTGFRAVQDGIVISFEEVLNENSATETDRYEAQCWEYRWTERYGSPEYRSSGREGRDDLSIVSARVTDDGKALVLSIPDLRPTMQLHLNLDVPFADGVDHRSYLHGTLLDLEPSNSEGISTSFQDAGTPLPVDTPKKVATLLENRHPDPFVVYEGKEGPGKGRKIVFVTGDEEYRSEEGMPLIARILAEQHGFTCTVLFSINRDSHQIDPETLDNIPGLRALDDADLMVIFTRFRDLPDSQMKHIADYVESGRPIVGLRTATHAFNTVDHEKYRRYGFRGGEWDGGFGREVLGETWVAHHGGHGSQSTRGIIPQGSEGHPILRGIQSGDVWDPSDVYTVRLPLPEGCLPILLGQVLDGMSPDDPPAPPGREGEGKRDLNDPMMPVAWVRKWQSGAGEARVFTTTLGASQAFTREGTRRLLINACYWTLGMDDQIDGNSDVRITIPYEPSPFGFAGHVRDVYPADLED